MIRILRSVVAPSAALTAVCDPKIMDYGNPKACRDCPLRARCTNGVRSVSRIENEDALDRMAQRLAARPDILDRRREIVEHPFGSIKQWMNQGAFLMRGSITCAPSSASRHSSTISGGRSTSLG